MPQIQRDVDLSTYNTFKVHSQASYFMIVNSVNEITDVLKEYSGKLPILTLGQGANVLFAKDYPGLVIVNNLKGRKVTRDGPESVEVELASGEIWHDFVMWAVENGMSGIENLALIPGTVGAAPVGNIAAYGQTAGEVIKTVKAILATPPVSPISLTALDCQFYYRDSAFKHDWKDKYFLTSVVFKLSKTAQYDVSYHSRYETLQEDLKRLFPEHANSPYSPKEIAQAVVSLRTRKLPDWRVLGTAGSFFKNPFVSKNKFAQLQKSMPDLQAYPVNAMLYPNPNDPVFRKSDRVKIPAGRLLDELGWKGKRIGNVGTFEKHALVVVNYGATGQEILEFTQKMQEDIKKNFEIDLEPEVNII